MRNSFSHLQGGDDLQKMGQDPGKGMGGAFQWQTSLTSFCRAGIEENLSIKCTGLLPVS